MGNTPSRFSEEDEGGGITFVKGIRLSDKVINRMKHSSKVNSPQSPPESQTPVSTAVPAPSIKQLLPLLTPAPPLQSPPAPPPPQEARPTPPSVEHVPPVKLVCPPPVNFHSLPPSSVESAETEGFPLGVTPPLPEVKPPVVPESVPPPDVETETSAAPQMLEQTTNPVVLHPAVESSPSSPPCELVKPASSLEPAALSPSPVEAQLPPPSEPSVPSSPVDSAPADAAVLSTEADTTLATPVFPPPAVEEVPQTVDATSPPLEPSAAPTLTLDASLDETSSQCRCEKLSVVPIDVSINNPAADEELTITTRLPPPDEDEAPNTVSPSTTVSPTFAELLEEELRRKIKAEMQRSLEDEIDQKRQKLQQQLEEIRVQARAEAKAAALAQVEQQVKETLKAEKAANTEKLMESIDKEKKKGEDEKLMVQLYWMELKSHQLEEKEKEMKRREALYKEHVAKLEAKCSEFYKVSAENFQKGKEETHKRFTRFNIQPVCGDLQGQLLKCYKENPGKTLSCSRIASAYMQCVDNAKKVQIQT